MMALGVTAAVNAVMVHQSGFSGDEPYYERMASHPGGPHNFPYAFRVGLPYLVHLLPFGHEFSWELLALLAGAAAAGALSALMRELSVAEPLNIALSLCFAVSPNLLVQLLRNGRGVDAAATLVIILGTLFIVRRERLALGVTLLVGATVHESCLFLIPLAYAVWADAVVDFRAGRDVALATIAPILFYLYLRTSIVAVGERYQPGYTGSFLTARFDVIRDAVKGGGWHVEIRRLFLAFGPLWFVAPVALRNMTFARRGLVLFCLCLASMTFALDWGRAAFFAAPVIYGAASYVLTGRRRVAWVVVALLALTDIGYAGYMQLHGVRHGLDSTAGPARGPVR